MRNIAELINQFHCDDKQCAKRNIDEKTIFHIATRVIISLYGALGGEKVAPRFFKDGKIFFFAESSLWANEVWMEREKIKDAINRELGQDEVKSIVVSERK